MEFTPMFSGNDSLSKTISTTISPDTADHRNEKFQPGTLEEVPVAEGFTGSGVKPTWVGQLRIGKYEYSLL